MRTMNKHSKHRPLMDALEVAIARNECSPHDMYQNMMGTCDQDEKEIAELKAENERLKEALTKINQWQLPEAELRSGEKCSYGVAYGSNGERDYMRSIAYKALK